MPSHVCPICARTGLDVSERYPRYVCSSCAARASGPDGRRLNFTNWGLGGGFVASYADNGQRYMHGGNCQIDGVPCFAEEARFGGIVIQVRDPS